MSTGLTCEYLAGVDGAEFRDRGRRSYVIALMLSLNMRQGMGQIRAAATFSEVLDTFVAAPEMAVQGAFLRGWEYARWESEGEFGDIPAGKALEDELRRCPDLKSALEELHEVGQWAMKSVIDTLAYASGRRTRWTCCRSGRSSGGSTGSTWARSR